MKTTKIRISVLIVPPASKFLVVMEMTGHCMGREGHFFWDTLYIQDYTHYIGSELVISAYDLSHRI